MLLAEAARVRSDEATGKADALQHAAIVLPAVAAAAKVGARFAAGLARKAQALFFARAADASGLCVECRIGTAARGTQSHPIDVQILMRRALAHHDVFKLQSPCEWHQRWCRGSQRVSWGEVWAYRCQPGNRVGQPPPRRRRRAAYAYGQRDTMAMLHVRYSCTQVYFH